LALCLDPNPLGRPPASKLFCLLHQFETFKEASTVLSSPAPKGSLMPQYDWVVADLTKPRVMVLPSGFSTCDAIAKNIWNLVHLRVGPESVLFESCQKLFQLLKNEDWSNNKCAVIAAVLTGCLIKRSSRFQSTWCSRIAGCNIADYEYSLTQALTLAITNPEWSQPCLRIKT